MPKSATARLRSKRLCGFCLSFLFLINMMSVAELHPVALRPANSENGGFIFSSCQTRSE